MLTKTTLLMIMMRRKRRAGRREIKAVSMEAVHAQAAFYHHFKSASPNPEPTRSPADPLPVQLNLDAPVSGPCKLVLRSSGGSVGGETPGVAQCPVCYDVLVPGTGNRQLQDHVSTGNDVTKRRLITAACADNGCCLVTNSRSHVNSFNSMYSV